MKKTVSIAIAIIFIALLAGSCIFNSGMNSGVCVVRHYTEEGCDFTENRTPGDFNSIKASGPFNVYFIKSFEQRVVVEGKEEYVSKVITEVKDGELNLRLEKGFYDNLVLRVIVFSPDVIEMKTTGSGDLKATGQVSMSGGLKVTTSGSGDVIFAEVICSDLTIRTSGSGDVELDNVKVDRADFSTSGSGDIMVKGFSADDASVTTTGSGDISFIHVGISGDLKLKSSGSGEIGVNGRCNRVEAHSSGSGDIFGDLKYSSIESSNSGSGKVLWAKNSR